MLPAAIVAYLALFATVGFLFLLASLILGRFLRPHAPTAQKLAIYECGEPAVGSGAIQFDLRFYVVALVFLIFEVEVAFFFPTAALFGQAVHLLPANGEISTSADATDNKTADCSGTCCTPQTAGEESGKRVLTPFSARAVAMAAMVDLGLFFAILLVAFAFVWRRGDLDWVKAMRHPATPMETAALMAKLRRGDV
jgi:NADH-quinone oxidoreductase subunit A